MLNHWNSAEPYNLALLLVKYSNVFAEESSMEYFIIFIERGNEDGERIELDAINANLKSQRCVLSKI